MKQDNKKSLIRRLKIVEGQVKALQRQVDEEVYCVDIIHQTMAVKNALSGVEDLLLENHLSTHVAEQMKNGDVTKATKEIMDIYRLSRKK